MSLVKDPTRGPCLDGRPDSSGLPADRPKFDHRQPSRPAISVVLPCLNEEASVGACVQEALAAMEGSGLDGEVIVVDNNCTDGSAEVASVAGAWVVREVIPGYGAALRAGIAAARGDIVVTADADWTYPLHRIAELVAPVSRGEADLVVGARLDAATRRSMPFLHRFLGTPVLSWLVRRGVGRLPVSDSQSGFRAFRRSAIDSLQLSSTGMEFASEMLIRAGQQQLRVSEIQTGYRARVGQSKLSTWSDGLRHLRLILRLSPHIPLWYPGLAFMGLATVSYAGSLIQADAGVGAPAWQPTFLSTILLVLGLVGATAGAVLGRHLPTASPTVRRTFAWVSAPRSIRRARQAGLAVASAGIALDGALFIEWVAGNNAGVALRTALAGLSQGLILAGVLLASFTLIYQVLQGHGLGADEAAESDEAAEC